MKASLAGGLSAFLLVTFLAPATAMAQALVQPTPEEAASFEACQRFERAACDIFLAGTPDSLLALFMRGLAAELVGDHRAALADFTETVSREPRHFGAQLWRHVTAAALGEADDASFRAYLDDSKLPPWPKVLGELYLGTADAKTVVALAEAQPGTARAEALCAAQYHVGRAALLAGDKAAAEGAFRAALATGATHVFEYQAAQRALQGNP